MLAQRALELVLAKYNERELKNTGAIEIDNGGYHFIVGMHVAFFVCLLCEKLILHRALNHYGIILVIFFCLAQFLRYWSIASLGIYWNTKILVAPHHPLIRKGPYQILRHPNYVAVEIEFAVVPLIFSCFLTSLSFTILNAFVLRRRIGIEMRALKKSFEIYCE